MPFTAKYDGLCHECKEPISAGDQLEWVEGSAVHVSCEPDAVRDRVARPTCPICWETTAVNGACGCDPE